MTTFGKHAASVRRDCASLGLLFFLALCFAPPVNAQLRHADLTLGLPATPAVRKTPAHEAAVQLGKRLFNDTRLSADGKVSCSKCHLPERAFTDGRARSSGHNGQLGTRNAPSLLNVAYLGSLFWDGRAADLETQALMPLMNPVEHALPSNDMIGKLVRQDPTYTREFAKSFAVDSDQINGETVGRAIAAYERTLMAAGSPFDRFLYGHDRNALTAAARRGLELFRGRAQCAACHLIGPDFALLTDGQFHMAPMGLARSVTDNLPLLAKKVMEAANRSELEGLIATHQDVAALGRFVVTQDPADIGKFKTPSLRNVALTAPYMHDGSVKTLEEAVGLELYGRGAELSYPIALTVTERQDLIEFLNALTSPYAIVSSKGD